MTKRNSLKKKFSKISISNKVVDICIIKKSVNAANKKIKK